MLRSALLLALILGSSGSLNHAESSRVSGDLLLQIAEIQDLFRNMECTVECRTDYCTDPTAHDIVGSVNRTHAGEYEMCNDHPGTCAEHDCNASFGMGQPSLYEAVEELRHLPSHALLRATELIPELQWEPGREIVHVSGCSGSVVANIGLHAANDE